MDPRDRPNSAPLPASDRELLFERVFDAPRELVFKAWSDPKHLAEWWGPNGFSTTTRRFELKPGGVWRFVMHGPDGRDYENRIVYEEVVRPERLVYRHGGGDDVEPVQFTVTVIFAEEPNDTTRLTMRMVFPSRDERDRVAQTYGAIEGAHQTLQRLAVYLREMG